MSDMISRKAVEAIEIIDKNDRNYRTYNLDDAYDDGFYDAIYSVLDLPDAEPESRWIPCEESLPEMGKRVLICGKKGGIAIARRAKYLEEFDGWTFWMRGGKPMDAIAWMPLPKPYGGDTDEAD